MTRPVVLAAIGDVHAGSTVGLCPPEGVKLDDGGRNLPSKLQLWLWDRWETFWRAVEDTRRQHNATLGILCNGDACDGPGHHDTHQSISDNAEAQSYIAGRVFSVPKAMEPDWWVFVKGTPVHVGKGADSESALARSLGAERDPSTDSWTWYRWAANIHGLRIDATHHGRTGGRPWTMASAAGILSVEILVEHHRAGQRPPDLCFRSHKHTPWDSGPSTVPRIISLPAWQSMTEFGYRVVPEKAVSQVFGGTITVIHPDGTYDTRTLLYRPDPTPPWRPEGTEPIPETGGLIHLTEAEMQRCLEEAMERAVAGARQTTDLTPATAATLNAWEEFTPPPPARTTPASDLSAIAKATIAQWKDYR